MAKRLLEGQEKICVPVVRSLKKGTYTVRADASKAYLSFSQVINPRRLVAANSVQETLTYSFGASARQTFRNRAKRVGAHPQCSSGF